MIVSTLVAASLFGTARMADAFDRLNRWLGGSEETLVIFPTYARLHDDGDLTIPVRAWVYEPEVDSRLRDMLVSSLGDALEIEDDEQRERFERRIHPFLVDNERGKKIRMILGDSEYVVGRTAPDGHVSRRIRIPREVAADTLHIEEGERWLEPTFEAEFGTIEIRVPLIEREGTTVISDLDDTIKRTNVLDRDEMLRNTFLREFDAVDGMAALYRSAASESGVQFHYLSASPWQLLPFLEPFLEESGFPAGLFHLRQFRPKSISSPLEFIGDSSAYKVSTIERLFSDFPDRSFVLVGDSGEHDPEVYGEVARNHPGPIAGVFVRTVEGADNSDQRFGEAFDDVPDDVWTTFEKPSEIHSAFSDAISNGSME